ncbi:unnamed protein product [Rotaria sordida]|uniref:TRAF-type domain-containing protein n=1 Tax=Rotaria sordida TaxID=392033 RepID=A0A814QPW5_9BILA|nr:unnamed protein product [Rotaria sordida]
MITNCAPCPRCGKLVSVNNLSSISDTLNNMLRKLRIECTLCGQTELLRGNFDDHINQECPNVRVSCPAMNNKCPWIGQRNDLKNHISTCVFHQPPLVVAEIAAATKLSTKDLLSKQPISFEEKSYYEECKEYYHITGKPLISIAEEVFDNNIELKSSSLKIGIDEECNQFDLQSFLTQFCNKLHINIDDIVVKQIQVGSSILEAEIPDKLGSNDKQLRLKMIYQSITDKLQEEFGKMKIFFLFMGPIKSLFKIQKYRTEIKLNPQYNRIYDRDYDYWEGPLHDGRDRGNKPYYCPIGWKRCSLYVTDKFYEKFKGWCICYHGTKFSNGLSILLSGLKPARIKAYGDGIYATPSVNYASHPRYSEIMPIDSSHQKTFFKSGKYLQFILECRVHPNNIKKTDEETLSVKDGTTIDSNIKNEDIEWVIDNRNKTIVDFNDPDSPIICTGLLIRVTDNHPGLLPQSQWWFNSHLCDYKKCCALGIDLDSLEGQRQHENKCNIIYE